MSWCEMVWPVVGRGGLDEVDHGIDRKHLGRGEREAAPLRVVGPGSNT